MTSKQKALKIANLLLEKKAHEVLILELRDLTIITDYFVICSASSTTQVQALTEHVEEMMDKDGFIPLGIEGFSYAHWVLMDYGDVIVHIFLDETRKYYELEKLWLDAPRIETEEAISNKSPAIHK